MSQISARIKGMAAGNHARYVILVMIMAMSAMTAFAQTAVPLSIDVNAIFTQTNSWMDALMPVFAIGAGITIAIAIITLVVTQIVKGFRGNL